MNGYFIWYKNCGSRLFRFVTVHAFNGRTDELADFDNKTVRMHSQSHGKNHQINRS